MVRWAIRNPRSLLAFLLAATVAVGCGSSGGAATTSDKPGPTSGTPTSPAPAAKEVVLKDPVGDCIDAANGQPAACPSAGLDIRSIKLASGSLRITYTVGSPGLPSLSKRWRAFLDVDVDGSKTTGSQRLFKINNEVIGSDLDIEATATGGPMGEAAATVTVWAAKGTIVKTFGEADGVTAAWTTDTTLEIVVPDPALAALVDSVRPGSVGAGIVSLPPFAISWMCLEEWDDLGDFQDCLRQESVDVDGDDESTN
jgi:hypothetical protein